MQSVYCITTTQHMTCSFLKEKFNRCTFHNTCTHTIKMSETLKEKESKFFEFLKTLSPSEKTHMRTYLNEVSWRHHWRKHFKNISKIRSDWRRKMLPSHVRHAQPATSQPRVESDPETWMETALGPEMSCSSGSGSSSGLVRRQCMNWFEHLYVELKKYLLQKYIPGMSDSDANKSAMIFLDEIRQLRRESDEPVMSNAFKTNTLHQIDLMDAEIKNGLLGWFADRGIESMYKTNRPYENVANYVVLNEYDASDWNKIYPLLGKTDINSIDDHSVQQANLLKVLKKMEKMSSHNALSARRGSGGGGGGRKLKTQRLKRKSKKMQNK